MTGTTKLASALLAVVAGLTSAGCGMSETSVSPAGATRAPAASPEATARLGDSPQSFTYQEVPLPSGQTVRCATWVSPGPVSGLSCDWDHPLTTKTT